MQGYVGNIDIGDSEGDFPTLEMPEPHVLHMGAFRHAPRSAELHPPQPALIRSINFSDDGLHCLSASGDGKVRVYDVGSVMMRDQLNLCCAKTAFSHSSAIAITTPYHVSDTSVGFLDIEEGVYISRIPICGNDALLGSKRDRNGGGGWAGGMSTPMFSTESQDTVSTASSEGSVSSANVGDPYHQYYQSLLRGGSSGKLGPMCTSISVNPINDITCVGCKTGEVFLVDPSIGTPLVSIHTSNLESVVGTCFSRCGQFIVIATSFSVEVHKLSKMLESSSLTNNKQNTARVVYTMPPCHKNSSTCTGYASVDCGSCRKYGSRQTRTAKTPSLMIMAACGCGEGELLNFDMHTSTLSKAGGFPIATPSRCFLVGGLVPNSTGLPFRIPATEMNISSAGTDSTSSMQSLPKKDCIVGVWKAPSCGALFTTPANTNTSLIIQGTHTNNIRAVNGETNNWGQENKDNEERCTGLLIRDPLNPTIKYQRGGENEDGAEGQIEKDNTINQRQFSAARAFLSCEHDSGGAPRVLAVNPRFGIVAGAHRVLNWWALESNLSSKN